MRNRRGGIISVFESRVFLFIVGGAISWHIAYLVRIHAHDSTPLMGQISLSGDAGFQNISNGKFTDIWALVEERDAAIARMLELQSELKELRSHDVRSVADCDPLFEAGTNTDLDNLVTKIEDERQKRQDAEAIARSCLRNLEAEQSKRLLSSPSSRNRSTTILQEPYSDYIYRPDSTQCFSSQKHKKHAEKRSQRRYDRPSSYLTRGWNLTDFSVSFWLKLNSNCTAGRGKEAWPNFGRHWYDGCGIIVAAPGAAPPGAWALAGRRYRKVRSRNDWGITIHPYDGTLMFGVGHRAPLRRTLWWRKKKVNLIPKHHHWRNTEYSGEDHTLHSRIAVNDAEWHYIVAERNATKAQLYLYIDGIRQGCSPSHLSKYNSNDPEVSQDYLNGMCYGVGNNSEALDDAHFRIAVGWGLDGCVRNLELRDGNRPSSPPPHMWAGPKAVRHRMDATSMPGQGLPKIPLFYYFLNNEESKPMHDSFRDSLRESGNFEGLEVHGIEVSNGTTNGARWSFKTDMILSQLKAHRGGVIMFADIDILWMRPVVPLIWHYLENQDLLLQRNDDFSLEANIGFMAMRCNDRVIGLWEKIHEITLVEKMSRLPPYTRPAIQGGDQRITNKLLFNPGLMDTPKEIKWSTLPNEIMTQVYQIDNNVQGHGVLMYWDYILYHSNKGGHHNASKGRSMKLDAIRRARGHLSDHLGTLEERNPYEKWGTWPLS